MNLSNTKRTIKIIQKFMAKNYFGDFDKIKQEIKNRDIAISKGNENAKEFTDKKIERIILKNSLRLSFEHTASKLYVAIKNNDNSFLKERLRYDQELSLELYKLYTDVKLPSTNKKILEFLK